MEVSQLSSSRRERERENLKLSSVSLCQNLASTKATHLQYHTTNFPTMAVTICQLIYVCTHASSGTVLKIDNSNVCCSTIPHLPGSLQQYTHTHNVYIHTPLPPPPSFVVDRIPIPLPPTPPTPPPHIWTMAIYIAS